MARPKGIPSIRRGKKLEEICGKEKSKKWRENLSKSHKGKLMGEENPSKRPEVREKIKKNHWSKTGKYKPSAWNKGLPKEKQPFYGKKHTEEYKIKLGLSRLGENHPNWKGTTPHNKLLRISSKWKIWRELVFLRDNFTCQNPNCEFCNNKIGGIELHPHHVKPLALYPELAFRVDNGITYCAEFHIKGGLHKKNVCCNK